MRDLGIIFSILICIVGAIFTIYDGYYGLGTFSVGLALLLTYLFIRILKSEARKGYQEKKAEK